MFDQIDVPVLGDGGIVGSLTQYTPILWDFHNIFPTRCSLAYFVSNQSPANREKIMSSLSVTETTEICFACK